MCRLVLSQGQPATLETLVEYFEQVGKNIVEILEHGVLYSEKEIPNIGCLKKLFERVPREDHSDLIDTFCGIKWKIRNIHQIEYLPQVAEQLDEEEHALSQLIRESMDIRILEYLFTKVPQEEVVGVVVDKLNRCVWAHRTQHSRQGNKVFLKLLRSWGDRLETKSLGINVTYPRKFLKILEKEDKMGLLYKWW